MKKIFAALGTTALLGAIAVAPAAATNGMDMIGYGTRSIGMGGADVAVAGDAGSVSGNPAAVSEAVPSSANIGLTVLMPTMTLKHNTPAGEDTVDGEAQYFPMPQIGYVHRLKDTPLALGFGLYAQGGMGVDFQGVSTGMGTTDELTSQVSFMRFNPLVSYEVNDAVSLGATLMVGYSQCEFSLYPNSGGMEVTGLKSFGFAGRVGTQVAVGPMVRLGAMYTTESTIKLKDGEATQAGVTYDAELQDFTWPQEFETGIAVTPAKGMTVAADVKWINWSDAIDKPVLVLDGNEANSFDMSWEDQWVYSLGVEYALNASHTLRAGYNYGKSPVKDSNLSPLFPAIVEHHATLGYGLTFGTWVVDLTYEHAFKNTQTNNNTDQQVNMFGPGLEVSHSQNTVSLEATYRY